MKELGEGIRVACIGTAGFITQMTGLDIALKVLIGLLTCAYLAGKLVKMFRDWNRPNDD